MCSSLKYIVYILNRDARSLRLLKIFAVGVCVFFAKTPLIHAKRGVGITACVYWCFVYNMDIQEFRR